MKRIIVFFMAIIMVLALSACGTNKSEDGTVSVDSANSGSVQEDVVDGEDNNQVTVPFTEYETMDDASVAAGFALTVPETAAGLSEQIIQVYEGDPNMIEVIYQDDNSSVTVRKEASGSRGESDISGVYVDYDEKSEEDVNGIRVTLTGDNQLVHVATWLRGDYNYSVYSDAGMSRSEMLDLIAGIQ